jgi:hypothetical protein
VGTGAKVGDNISFQPRHIALTQLFESFEKFLKGDEAASPTPDGAVPHIDYTALGDAEIYDSFDLHVHQGKTFALGWQRWGADSDLFWG